MKRASAVLTAAAVGFSAALWAGDDKIVPPGQQFRGYTYSEWQAKWWQTIFSIPVVEGAHPLINGGPFAGEKKVVFLAAQVTPDMDPKTIDVTIKPGTALFFPVVNFECSLFEPPPFNGTNEQELRDQANFLADQASGVSATLDGDPVDVEAFRTESALFTWGPLPADNIFGAPTGTTSQAVDAGYYLMVKPLKPGTHTIHITGAFGAPLSGFLDTTFVVTVSAL